MSTEEAARSYFAAAAARDPEGMASHWHAEGIEDLVPIGILRGPDEVRAFFTELFTAVPDFEFVVEQVTAGERVAAVQWRASGTFEGGPFQGIDPTGRRVTTTGLAINRIVEGKLAETWIDFDLVDLLRQLGAAPATDAGSVAAPGERAKGPGPVEP